MAVFGLATALLCGCGHVTLSGLLHWVFNMAADCSPDGRLCCVLERADNTDPAVSYAGPQTRTLHSYHLFWRLAALRCRGLSLIYCAGHMAAVVALMQC